MGGFWEMFHPPSLRFELESPGLELGLGFFRSMRGVGGWFVRNLS